MRYKLYKIYENEPYFYGEYHDALTLASAANQLGFDGFEIKVEVIENV